MMEQHLNTKKIYSDIRTLLSSPKIDRKDCEFWINKLSTRMSFVESESPILDVKSVKEDEELQKRRKNSLPL